MSSTGIKKAIEKGTVATETLSDVVNLGKNIAAVLVTGAASGNPAAIFNGMKLVAHDTRDIFSGLGVNIKGVNSIVKNADKVADMLNTNSLVSDSIQTAYSAITSLVSGIIKLVGDIASCNVAGIVEDSVNIASAAYKTLKVVVAGLKKFVEYYKTTLKPMLHEVGIKIKAEAKEIKADLKKLFHIHKKDAADATKVEASKQDKKDLEKFGKFWDEKSAKIDTKLEKVQDSMDEQISKALADLDGNMPSKAVHMMSDTQVAQELVEQVALIVEQGITV